MSGELWRLHLVTVDGTAWQTRPFEGDPNHHVQRLIHDEHIDSYEIVISGTSEREFVEPSTVSFTRAHIVALWTEKVATS